MRTRAAVGPLTIRAISLRPLFKSHKSVALADKKLASIDMIKIAAAFHMIHTHTHISYDAHTLKVTCLHAKEVVFGVLHSRKSLRSTALIQIMALHTNLVGSRLIECTANLCAQQWPLNEQKK